MRHRRVARPSGARARPCIDTCTSVYKAWGMAHELQLGRQQASGLVDVLDRVLDKGLVVAGDVKISLAEVELLTIRIRLIVCSIDKAQEIGLDWWKHDSHLSPGKNRLSAENEELRKQIRLLERKVASLSTRRVTDAR